RPAGRMPDLKLQPSEAADIAAWLLKPTSIEGRALVWGKQDDAWIAEGKIVFAELRCANCHTPDHVETGPAKGLNEIELSAERTCYRNPAPTMPQYRLDPAQTRAVEAALRAIRIDAEVNPAAELQFIMLRFNCLACHERDGIGGVGR